MTPRCTLCGALCAPSRLAPYYPLSSDERRHACEHPACRDLARAEMRCGVIVEGLRRVA